MPSTTSSSVSAVLASSTVMTPSLPTFCIALAIISPIDLSPFEEMVPTCATSAESLIFFERLAMSLTASATARSTPRLRSIGFMPAATYLAPSRTIDWARTVAVVVPSPALSLVLEATSSTICAPMFWSLSFSSISFATETPSFLTVGPPKLRSRTTLRPFGPSVTFTAFARMFTPSTILARAESPNTTSLAAIFQLLEFLGYNRVSSALRLLLHHGHDVFFAHHEQFVAVDLDGLACVLAEQDAVTNFHVEGDLCAFVVTLARADCQNFALIRLFCCGFGDHDARRSLGFLIQTFDDHAIMQRTKVHTYSSLD